MPYGLDFLCLVELVPIIIMMNTFFSSFVFQPECSIVEEEVIAAHGTVEEYIAFDNMYVGPCTYYSCMCIVYSVYVRTCNAPKHTNVHR